MVSFSDIKGQSNAIKLIRNSLSSGRLAGSYLFSGPSGVGRAQTAKVLIKTIICKKAAEEFEPCGRCGGCLRVDTLEHPDLIWIKPEKNKAIKIEDIRVAREKLNLKPYEAPAGVCVIDDAHMMTVEASNALLKILEEPPGESLIILISDKKELLLDTIISRCIEVRFSYLSPGDTREIIMRNSEVDEETACFLSIFAQGSPGRAMEMIEEDVMERKDDIVNMLKNIMKEENPSCMTWDNEDKGRLLEDLELLIMLFRDMAFDAEGLGDMSLFGGGEYGKDIRGQLSGKSVDKIYNTLKKLIDMKWALSGNVNPKLVSQILPAAIAV